MSAQSYGRGYVASDARTSGSTQVAADGGRKAGSATDGCSRYLRGTLVVDASHGVLWVLKAEPQGHDHEAQGILHDRSDLDDLVVPAPPPHAAKHARGKTRRGSAPPDGRATPSCTLCGPRGGRQHARSGGRSVGNAVPETQRQRAPNGRAEQAQGAKGTGRAGGLGRDAQRVVVGKEPLLRRQAYRLRHCWPTVPRGCPLARLRPNPSGRAGRADGAMRTRV
jgi:hypothetical protein